nr:MAG TPA: hypothetical protein [Caudoviricetes sp.]DAZ75036.1 MAG TPA: hypothetical protein [Caudoviricetes sp.]
MEDKFPLFNMSCHIVYYIVRTVYYDSIVSYNYHQRLSVSEGLPF